VEFDRPRNLRFLEAVQIAGSRYGQTIPPVIDFRLYVLNAERQILADVPFPYALIERGDLLWYTLRTPSIEVPDRFYIAVAFNPGQTKGIYLGKDQNVEQSHSYVGLPDSGFEPVKESYDWMIRAYLSEEPSGDKAVMRLADWKPPVEADPFVDCIEARYDDGESDGIESYTGAGPALLFRPADFLGEDLGSKNILLRGFRVYGSRYGSGFDPDKAVIKVSLIDPDGKVRWDGEFPYSLFSYREKWVDLILKEPIPPGVSGIAGDVWTVALDPEADKYKGVYFHYNQNPAESHSLVGTVEQGFELLPDRQWMIRTYFSIGPQQPIGR
jgi:hypothetical protein